MFLYSKFFLLVPIIILIFTLSTQRKHFLMVLLTLETITLSIITLLLFSSSSSSSYSPFLSMFVLTLAAVEASLGLALLVVMSRQAGNDLMSATTQLKC